MRRSHLGNAETQKPPSEGGGLCLPVLSQQTWSGAVHVVAMNVVSPELVGNSLDEAA